MVSQFFHMHFHIISLQKLITYKTSLVSHFEQMKRTMILTVLLCIKTPIQASMCTCYVIHRAFCSQHTMKVTGKNRTLVRRKTTDFKRSHSICNLKVIQSKRLYSTWHIWIFIARRIKFNQHLSQRTRKTYIFSMPKIEMFYGECIHNWHLHAVPQWHENNLL